MKSWYNIKGQAGDASAEVYILDEIGGFGISAAQFIGEVKALGAKSLTVYIDSPGGDIFGGLAIANWLAGQPNVTTHVLGMAASMANVIAQAGRVRRMAENAYLMTHNPISPYFGGNADDFRDQADWLDRLGNTLSKTIAARTGKTAEVVSKWLDNETWFDAAQAKEANLTDEVMPTAPVQGNFNLARFNAVPQPLQTAMTARNSQPHTIMSKFAALFGLATSTPPPAAPPPAAQAPTDRTAAKGTSVNRSRVCCARRGPTPPVTTNTSRFPTDPRQTRFPSGWTWDSAARTAALSQARAVHTAIGSVCRPGIPILIGTLM